MTWSRYHTAMQRAFPRKTKFEQTRGGVRIIVPCVEGHTGIEEFDKRMPPDKARKHMTNQGWRFSGTKARCPDHAQSEEKPMEVPAEVAKIAAEQDRPLASPDAKRARRDALAWLDETFDIDKGRFKSGSDKTIAEEVGLSEQAVAGLRDEFYGPLKEAPEIIGFRKDVANLEQRVKDMQADASRLATSILADLGKLAERIKAFRP